MSTSPGQRSTHALLRAPSGPLRAGLWLASRALRVLGPARYAFADAIGMGVYAFAGGSRRRTAANHRRLDPSISVRTARARARASYRHYMRTSFDFVWGYGVPQHAMHRHFRAYGLEHVWQALEEHGGGIFALAHFGSWDVAAADALASGIRLTTVMGPIGPDLVTRIAAWARRHQEMDVLMADNAARGLLRAVRRGRFAAILCDIPERGETVAVDFCGGVVEFSTAPAWLARIAKVPIMPVDCWRHHGLSRLYIHAPVAIDAADDDRAVMQRVARVLERAIRREPSWWYPFGDVYVA